VAHDAGQHTDLTDLVIRMDDVSVRRGDTTLLRDVDWSVELDERWVVLGPNGAGKTTLLRMAAAELHPTTRIRCDDHFATRDRAFRAHASQAAPDNPVVTIAIECDSEPVQDTMMVRKDRPRRAVGA